MRELKIMLPDKVEFNDRELTNFFAAKLYESGKLTLGQAAEMVGISKESFAEILADYDVSFINYPASDIKRDASAIR
ncbi:MAG TPA: UPF0175 family protein [Bacteroidia bacterium]|nr:UPF0175 family protein [Bacteroidia bacterium]